MSKKTYLISYFTKDKGAFIYGNVYITTEMGLCSDLLEQVKKKVKEEGPSKEDPIILNAIKLEDKVDES